MATPDGQRVAMPAARTALRTAAWVVLHALLRIGVVALLLLAYDAVYDLLVAPTPDADIGKGLLAFLLLGALGLGWGVVDGVRLPVAVWLPVWALTALAVGLGWEVVLATAEEGRVVEASSVAFLVQLVGIPALVGAAVGRRTGGSRRPVRP